MQRLLEHTRKCLLFLDGFVPVSGQVSHGTERFKATLKGTGRADGS